MRRLAFILLGAAALLACLVVGAAVYVDHADVSKLARSQIETWAGRPVRMGSMRVSLGRLTHVVLTDLRLPSAADPTLPDFATARRAEADLELWPLLRGKLVVQTLSMDGVAVTLKRNKDGLGNWAPRGAAPRAADAPPPPPPSLPALLDVTATNADITNIGSSGNPFRIHLDRAHLATTSPTDPVALDAAGALQDVPVTVKGTTASYTDLQNRPAPFRMDLTLTTKRTTVTYAGTATDPLNFDGLDGAGTLDIPALGELLQSLGSPMEADIPVKLGGKLTALHRDWMLREASGALDQSPFTGEIHYLEGARGQPDFIAPTLAFSSLDLGRILARVHSKEPSQQPADTLPAVSLDPDPRIDAHLAVKALANGATRASDVTTHLVIQPGEVTLDQTSLGFGGGRITAALGAKPAGGGTRVTGTVQVAGVNARQLFLAAGSKAPPLNGPVSADAMLDLAGRTLTEGLGKGRTTVALSVAGGTIAQDLIRKVALDVRALFGEEGAPTRLECLLAVADFRDGVGTIGPVRLVTPEGAVDGWGEANPARGTIDMTLQSDRTTTGTLALDIPIRITGRLSDPSVAPSLEAARRRFGPARLGPWPADTVRFMRTSPCLKQR